ncbi:MAG: hypothetical protein B6I36_04090 [Desulfobacteraceae bacterium 4572_35.1]|nr:MAG: hypothetical protein B6I36_04090 [Desulfobacteraceae bacterium 4572_35.1]
MKGLMEQLKKAEFVKIECDLRFSEAIDVELANLLCLRRAIRSAAKYVLPPVRGEETAALNRFGRLLEPDLAVDPVARHHHQKCGPAFVFHHDVSCTGKFCRGDVLTLSATVWGGNSEIVHDFMRVLQALGKTGLRHDAGRFELVAVRGEDSAQNWQQVWQASAPVSSAMIPMRDASWWLNSYMLERSVLELKFHTPARLLVKKRPLFKADFKQIFPFVLRRVTSMLYSHCYLDLDIDIHELLSVIEQVEVEINNLAWHDWRELCGDNSCQPLGGLMGTINFKGELSQEVLVFLYLGSYMNLGKNAAFGAGGYWIEPKSSDL